MATNTSIYVSGLQFTNAVKSNLVSSLSLAFERGEIRILDDPVLLGELHAYEVERLPSGMLRYSAPDNLHDDCVMALALAWQCVNLQPATTANPFY